MFKEFGSAGWFFSPNDGMEGGGSDGGEGGGSSSADSEKPGNPEPAEEHKIPKSRFDEVNERMKTYKDELASVKEALENERTSKLKEQEEYKELYEQANQKLSKLKPLAEQAESWQETMERLLEAQMEEIPKEYRQLIPDEMTVKQRLDWISKNKSLLMKPVGPNVGAGERGSGSNKPEIELTRTQKEYARRFGYSEEEYKEMLANEEGRPKTEKE